MSSDVSSISVAVLAGGLGSRLRSVVPNTQKVVADVSGSPFLEHVLRQIEKAGFRHVVICTGHLSEQVRTLFEARPGKLRIEISEEPQPLGTAGAIRFALDRIPSPFVLVVNGDSYCDLDLQAFSAASVASPSRAHLVALPVDDAARFGRVVVAPGGLIERFEEKGRGGPGDINAGIYLFPTDLLREIPHGVTCSLEKETFPRLVERGMLAGYRAPSCRFIDIGTPESFAAAQKFFGEQHD